MKIVKALLVGYVVAMAIVWSVDAFREHQWRARRHAEDIAASREYRRTNVGHRRVYLKKYGGVCDGRHDDRAALKAALDALPPEGGWIVTPANEDRYCYFPGGFDGTPKSFTEQVIIAPDYLEQENAR